MVCLGKCKSYRGASGSSSGSGFATGILSEEEMEKEEASVREGVSEVRTLIRSGCSRRERRVDPGRWEA